MVCTCSNLSFSCTDLGKRGLKTRMRDAGIRAFIRSRKKGPPKAARADPLSSPLNSSSCWVARGGGWRGGSWAFPNHPARRPPKGAQPAVEPPFLPTRGGILGSRGDAWSSERRGSGLSYNRVRRPGLSLHSNNDPQRVFDMGSCRAPLLPTRIGLLGSRYLVIRKALARTRGRFRRSVGPARSAASLSRIDIDRKVNQPTSQLLQT